MNDKRKLLSLACLRGLDGGCLNEPAGMKCSNYIEISYLLKDMHLTVIAEVVGVIENQSYDEELDDSDLDGDEDDEPVYIKYIDRDAAIEDIKKITL